MTDAKQVTITAVHYYPVKSMRAITQNEVRCNSEGIIGDRRWMLIDSSGQFISQRHIPELAKISVNLTQSQIKLTHDDYDQSLVLPIEPIGDFIADTVSIWDDHLAGIKGYLASRDWLKTTLGSFRGKTLTLVKMPDVSSRQVEPQIIGSNRAFTGFADGYPFLVTNQSSLELLNTQMLKSNCSSIDMSRFRPNIVISGLDAFEEEQGGRLQFVNGAELELVKPCQRCQMITQDQTTGKVMEVGQPTKSLLQTQSIDPKRGAFFGQNAILSLNALKDKLNKNCEPPKPSPSMTLAVGQKLVWLPNQ